MAVQNRTGKLLTPVGELEQKKRFLLLQYIYGLRHGSQPCLFRIVA